MVLDMGYWTKVLKRIILIAISIIGLYIVYKLSLFFMPFLIAFIISIIIEPIIRKVMKYTKLERKISAIIVLIVFSLLIVGLIIWAMTSIFSEASNLLKTINVYFEKIYTQMQSIISSINFDRLNISQDIISTFQSSVQDFLRVISGWLKDFLTNLLTGITYIPTIGIYVVVTLLSTYFICADRLYILDQIEHHLPKTWVKRMGMHIREIIKTLGGYLKAQVILIIIAFVQVLIGLIILKMIGLNVKYPVLSALAIGFVDALPILGSGTVMIPWAVISAVNGDIKLALGILIIYAIIVIVRQILEPKIVSNKIGIHPIFTLIAMYTGFRAIGVSGLLIGSIILIILKNIYGTIIDKGVIKTIFDRK